MAGDAALKQTIGLELDAGDIERQIKALDVVLDTNIVKGVKQTLENIKETIKNTPKNLVEGAGKTAEDTGAFMKKSLGGLAKIVAGIALLNPLIRIGSQIFDAAGKIVDMLMVFLRPIFDAFNILLIPIMGMIRPLIQVFNTLIMPFRKAAIQGSIAATKLITEGTQAMLRGEEGGSELISRGFEGALSSAGLLLTGFMDIVFTPLKSIDFMGIGDNIANALETMRGSAQVGIAEVVIFSNTLDELKEVFPTLSGAVQQAGEITNELITTMESDIRNMDITEFTNKLSSIQTISKETAQVVASALTGDENGVNTNLDELATAAEESGIPLTNLVSGIDLLGKSFDKGTESLNNYLAAKGKVDSMEAFSAEKKRLDSSLAKEEVGYWDRIGAGFSALFDGEMWDKGRQRQDERGSLLSMVGLTNPLDVMEAGASEANKKAFDNQLQIIEDFETRNSALIETELSRRKGVHEMYSQEIIQQVNKTFSPTEGIIPITVKGGFTEVSTQTSEFKTEFTTLGGVVGAVVKDIIKFRKEAEASSKAAAKAAKEAKSKSSSNNSVASRARGIIMGR